MPSSEPLPLSETVPDELELRQPPLPDVSLHTGGLPAMDMRTMSGVGETKKGTCGKCANCLVCTRRAEGGE